ncbi:MAG TPA: OmpH family outer membrane protein [Bacteroidales bacterium]|nr:OmpH family outer membrane protein [Bacteroidales bacterium]HRW96498.1 OmpH family outer membrane protein [Bacteroidales bacterium]
MKKIEYVIRVFASAIFLMAFATSSYSQKFGYVDSEYILQSIPEYQDAQNELDELSKEWQTEIETEFAKIEQMYKAYQADAVLLPEDLKRKREDEIIKAEKDAKELQRKRFGQDGDLFNKRQELIKPIQEKVFNAIEEIATKQNYAFIFDKASGPVIMYVNPKYNISDEVLDQIGSIMGVRKQ